MNNEKFPTEEDKDERVKKMSKWITHSIYYTISTIMGFVLFHDTYFFPKFLGGNGDSTTIFHKDFPNIPETSNLVMYYMIQFGIHIYTLIDHVLLRQSDTKFYEYLLHHGMAVLLILFSYLSNALTIGTLVLITHDPCDVFLDLARFFNDLKKSKFLEITS